MKLQPILTPCKGTAADLSLSVDPKNPDYLQLFWGTALLQVVPRDKNSLLFRVVAGLLAGLDLKMSSLEECLDTTSKTLRKWSQALIDGDWNDLSDVFHGPGAETKLRPDIEQYVRKRYREMLEAAGDCRLPYGFREELVAEIENYWELTVCGETLRRVFREEDECQEPVLDSYAAKAVDEVPALEQSCEDEAEDDVMPLINAGNDIDPANSAAGCSPACGNDADIVIDENREEGCACAPEPGTECSQTRNVAPESIPNPASVPILQRSVSNDLHLSQHAGLFLCLPWFEKAFAGAPEIVRQTAAQILLGAVNQEQSKNIDFAGLELFVERPLRDITYQHTVLEEQLSGAALMDVFARNAKLLNLRKQRIFYVDPHHKHYTGVEKVLLGWSGKFHDVRKGIMMDFIHTQNGEPCFIRHFDSYYDARMRFTLLVERFRELFDHDASGFVWINDRGYWGLAFLLRIVENGDNFIQWEKGYKDDGWEMPFTDQGRFTIVRKRNNASDRIKVRVHWREQRWGKVAGGRRLIIRIKRTGGEVLEAAVVSNHATMSAEKILRLMLNRWIQENDFTYLSRHFGIEELSGRKFDAYNDIAADLEDRQVESRQYKRTQASRQSLRSKFGRKLIQLHGMPAVSLDQVCRERDEISSRAVQLSEQLDRIKNSNGSFSMLLDLQKAVDKLKEKFKFNRNTAGDAEKRLEVEAEAAALQEELLQLEAQIREMNRMESRLSALIEEQYVRPDMRKKALLDAIRITCRNIFRQPFNIFRPIYNDYRDDHVVLRQLSRSAGIVIKHADHIKIYLTPALHRQPRQWEQIRRLTEICTHRIRHCLGVNIHFLTGRSKCEIFAAIRHASKPADESRSE